MRSDLLLSEVNFSDSCECAIRPTTHRTSPRCCAEARTPISASIVVFSHSHAHLRHSRLPFPGAIRCETAARRSCKTALLSASTASTTSLASRATLELGQALRTRRSVRPSHTPVRAVLVLAPSRLAQRSSGLICHRHCGPAFCGRRQGCLAHVRSNWLTAARAHAIVLGRLDAAYVAHGEVDFWSATDAVSARSKTARVAGRWVDVTRAVPSRLAMLCELAWPLGSAPAYRMRELRFYLGGVNAHVHGCL